RDVVDRLIQKTSLRETAQAPLALEMLAHEVDEALQQTSEAMAQATNLLALVVAPRVSGARVRHVELLLLQPNLVMVVFIVSTGRVTKRVIDYPTAVDPGMVEWAR
ncbi:MAG: heat-inducible transcription repressor HrcA, partial [Actinobacteria bacterium]|nr:heat-inducible transcription repressor HrcA [Actinomycetota bacterium]